MKKKLSYRDKLVDLLIFMMLKKLKIMKKVEKI